jgi:Flp pilus assembly protein TadG
MSKSHSGPNPLRRLLGRFLRSERASTAVEAALIMPVLIFFTFGIIEFAMVMFEMNRANDATRRAARQIVIGNPIPDVTDLIDLDTTPVTCDMPGGSVQCSGGASVDNAATFTDALADMQLILPNMTSANLVVVYNASEGIDGAMPGVNTPMITVTLEDYTYNFIIAGVVPGMPTSITLPSFSTTLVGPSVVTGI